MDSDPTVSARQAMLPTMQDELRKAVEAGGPVWDTAGLQRDFEVLGFYAPFVVVKRRSDGARGSLQFTHEPRWYWGFEPE